MMKKTLSLMIMLSASLSTSLYARNAMRDLTNYRYGLEQALTLNDQTNVEIYATAIVGALTRAEITTAPKQQTYDGDNPLPIQVKNATYKWGKKATKQQAEELYRALDALAVAGSYEQDGSKLAKLLSGVFDPSKANKKTHIGLASKRYQTTLQAIKAKQKKSFPVLYALTQTAATQLPYAQSTYKGQVRITQHVDLLDGLTYGNFYPNHSWIKDFYVPTSKLQNALGGEHITTHLLKETKGTKSDGVASSSPLSAPPPPVFSSGDSLSGPPAPPLDGVPIAPPLAPAFGSGPSASPPPPPFTPGGSVGSPPPPSSGGGGMLGDLAAFKFRPKGDKGKPVGAEGKGGDKGDPMAAIAAAVAAKGKKGGVAPVEIPKKAAVPVVPLHANDSAIDPDQWSKWVAAWGKGGESFRVEFIKYLTKVPQQVANKQFFNNSPFKSEFDTYGYAQGKDAIVK